MAIIINPLTDAQVKQAKPTDKAYKLSDGGGLYLHVSKTGNRSWRIDYRRPVTRTRATITLGQYPTMTLAQARAHRLSLKENLADGIDPFEKRKEDEREKVLLSNNTFRAIADEYMSRKSHVSDSTIRNNHKQLRRLNKFIGDKPITAIKPTDVLEVCRAAEAQGYLETAVKVRTMAGQVFRYAVQTGRCERDVTQDLIGAIKTPVTTHYPAITDPKEFGIMLSDMEDYQGSFEVRTALKLLPLLFVRSGELRYGLWNELDLSAATWSFTPRKTKRSTELKLIVPLPTQAVELFRELADHARSDYMFPAIHTTVQPMSENTMNQALKRLGYEGTKQTVHGFRASARTMLVEQLKYPEQLVEMQLGHRVRDMHGRAYNRVTLLDERREMMQGWADYLDKLKQGV